MAKLTIGLPVYNGAETLTRSLDNLLSQTLTDFTLLISDNASTDRTAEICEEYAQRDPRIKYFRQSENIVWNENFRFLLMKAETPYFMWATHDDIWLPRFAEENIRLLDANPSAVCSVSKIVYFDGNGCERLSKDTAALVGTPSQRLRDLFLRMDSCGRFYGVYRTAALRESFPPGLRIFGADWLIVALSLLRGNHLEVEEVLLKREDQPEGHYVQRFGKVDHFDPQPFEFLWPLRRLQVELRNGLPRDAWQNIRWPLRYLDLRMLVQLVQFNMPRTFEILRPLRAFFAKTFHQRWQAK